MDFTSILIDSIILLVGVASHVIAALTNRQDTKKMAVQVKKEANTDELKTLIVRMLDDNERQKKLYSDIEAENVALKRQYNRLLSELKGVRYEEKSKPKHKEV